jgi:hypothetical protein
MLPGDVIVRTAQAVLATLQSSKAERAADRVHNAAGGVGVPVDCIVILPLT